MVGDGSFISPTRRYVLRETSFAVRPENEEFISSAGNPGRLVPRSGSCAACIGGDLTYVSSYTVFLFISILYIVWLAYGLMNG